MSLFVARLKASGGTYIVPVTKTGSKQVCREYYARLYGVATNVVRRAGSLAKGGCRAPKRRSPASTTEKAKYDVAYAFWFIFFEQHCQKPNDEIRLFPVAKPYRDIYREYFKPWFKRLVKKGEYSAKNKPKFSTWKLARKAPEFLDVKKRAEHTHARCTECSRLKKVLLDSFVDGGAEQKYLQERRYHDMEVEQWRKLEAVAKAVGTNNPSEELIIMHDGTSALGLPRTTNRTLKNLDPFRFEVTPWLSIDYSGGLKDYLYCPTSSTPKDANTLISQLHAVVRRAKSDYNHPRHRARKATFIADSASENKNNTLFAYCTDLIDNGWFDEILLLFGPVGHTHNGVDATHKVHNQNVAGNFSGDLGHFVQNFVKGFSGKHSEGSQMPTASILARTLDWNRYYAQVLRPISGFTKTKYDPVAARGFRIKRQKDGTIDLTWKTDPALEKDWRGKSGFANDPGFYMLKSMPQGVPTFVVPPPKTDAAKLIANKLKSSNMRNCLASQELEACAEWVYQAELTGVIPIHKYLEETTPPGEWGRLAEIGAIEGKRGEVRVIEDYWDMSLPQTRKTMWSLPVSPKGSHLDATTNHFHFSKDKEYQKHRPMPAVRYRGESKKGSQVMEHPSMMDGGWMESSDENDVSPANHSGEDQADHSGDHPEAEHKEQSPARPREALSVHERFEEDFAQCIPGNVCVGLASTTEGPTPYIFVGIIKSVDREKREFMMKPFQCTKDSWLKECIDAKWNKTTNIALQMQPHYAVMAYNKKINDSRSLPKAMKDKVLARGNIVWYSNN
jgi:hypothetical protein